MFFEASLTQSCNLLLRDALKQMLYHKTTDSVVSQLLLPTLVFAKLHEYVFAINK